MSQRKQRQPLSKNDILSFVVLGLVSGSFILSWVDKDVRDTFADLAKVGVGGYIALMVPAKGDRPYPPSPDDRSQK